MIGQCAAHAIAPAQEDAAECCQHCVKQVEPPCNVWVFCDSEDGCGKAQKGECWLKHHPDLNVKQPKGARHSSVPPDRSYVLLDVC